MPDLNLGRLLLLNMDPKVWAARYGLPETTRPCEGCGVEITACIPFASGSHRGLISEDHGCLPQYRLRVMVPADPKQRLENEIFARYLMSYLED